MRTRALLGMLLVPAALALPSSADGQLFTEFSANLRVGLFGGVDIGLARYSPAPYGIYGTGDWGRRRGGYGRGYDDYCWDAAWETRWGRNHFGWDGYRSPSYSHLDFYHDCLSNGLDRVRWHSRRSYRLNRPRSRVVVAVMIIDPFSRPWGPYWACDPWARYWDGFRGRSRGGRAGYGGYGATRTIVTGLRSPRNGARFKEDPRGVRAAVPRTGRAGPSAAAAGRVREGAPRTAASPAAGARDRGRSAAPATRASDRPSAGSDRERPRAAPTRPSDAVSGRDGAAAARPGQARVGRSPGGATARATPATPKREARPQGRGRATVVPQGGGGGRPSAAPRRPTGGDPPAARARPEAKRGTSVRPEAPPARRPAATKPAPTAATRSATGRGGARPPSASASPAAGRRKATTRR